MAFYTDNSNPYGGTGTGGQGVLLSSKNKSRKAGDKVKAISDAAAAGPGPGAGSNPHQAKNDPMNSNPYGGTSTGGAGVLESSRNEPTAADQAMEWVKNRKTGEARQYWSTNEEGERVQQNMGKANLKDVENDQNPFTVGDLKDYDLSSTGDGSGRNRQKLSGSDVKGLLKQGGHSAEDVQALIDDLNTRKEAGEDVKAGRGAQKYLDNYIKRMEQAPGDGTPGEPGKPGKDKKPKPGKDNEGNKGGAMPTPAVPEVPGGAGPVDGSTGGNSNVQQVTNTNRQTGGRVSVGGDNSGTIDNSVNNTTNTNIENNQRTYGGSTRTMNISGVKDGNVTGAVDGLATAGTLGGMWAPDDSPASQSKFVNFYADENKALQKQYADYGTDTANKWVTTAAQNNPIDYEALDKRISGRQIYHQDQATLKTNEYMGDMWKFTPSDYTMPKALEKQDFSEKIGEATEKAYDRIDDM